MLYDNSFSTTFNLCYTPSTSKKTIPYAGDIEIDKVISPRSSKTAIHKLKQQIEKDRRIIRNLRRQVNRKNKKITSVEGLLVDLKQKKFISENTKNMFEVK